MFSNQQFSFDAALKLGAELFNRGADLEGIANNQVIIDQIIEITNQTPPTLQVPPEEPLAVLESLTRGTRAALWNGGAQSIEELTNMTIDQVLKIPEIGEKRADKLQQALKKVGLSLKEDNS